jgi:hypothetical protein
MHCRFALINKRFEQLFKGQMRFIQLPELLVTNARERARSACLKQFGYAQHLREQQVFEGDKDEIITRSAASGRRDTVD